MALLAPLASAQTLTNPIQGDYTDVYVVTGRVIDARGEPAARADLVVELEQRGVRAAPLRASTDCFGVFITAFDLREVRPDGKVRVTVTGPDGLESRAEAALDPFYRRTDLNLRYEGEWAGICGDQTPLWRNRVTVTGRILFRTEPYEEQGVTFHATPHAGRITLVYVDGENRTCPPSSITPGTCDANAGQVDERGDFRYSWVFHQPLNVTSDHHVELRVGDATHNLTVDPEWRIATTLLETSGRGPPPVETPAAPLAILALAVAAAALLARRSRR